MCKGLPLVHFSAQPASLKLHETTQRIPHEVFISSRKVDQYRPLVGTVDRDEPGAVTRPLLNST
jgi:hypothetical protein